MKISLFNEIATKEVAALFLFTEQKSVDVFPSYLNMVIIGHVVAWKQN